MTNSSPPWWRPPAIDLADHTLQQLVAHKVKQVRNLLQEAVEHWSPVTFSSSLGPEDIVLTDIIFSAGLDIEIFTLDTGRLPYETLNLLEQLETYYQRRIRVFFPETSSVEAMVAVSGINGFYDTLEKRKECCYVRKVIPLQRALDRKKGWVTGMRAAQSVTRVTLESKAIDEQQQIMKFNPLVEWTEKQVWAYIRFNHLPCNELHNRGYPSIGCAPCTRAISMDEEERAGRWWWETNTQRECGLHKNPDGTLRKAG